MYVFLKIENFIIQMKGTGDGRRWLPVPFFESKVTFLYVVK